MLSTVAFGIAVHASAAIVPSSAAPTAWVVPVLDRIEPTTLPSPTTTVDLEGGRREDVSFQIAVRAPVGGLTNVRFAVSPLAGSGGRLIGGNSVVLYRENFVTIKHHSPVFQPPSKDPNVPLQRTVFPDALIPFIDPATHAAPKPARYVAEPIEIAGGTDAAYWIDLDIPAGTAAGIYAGTYSVLSSQGTAAGNVRLTVLPFTAPLAPTLRSNMNSSTSHPRGEILELLRNKLMPDTVPDAREVALIDTFGLDTEDLGFFSGAYYGHCAMTPPPGVDAFRKAVAAHDPRLALYDFSADEVEKCKHSFPRLKAWARNMHAAGVPNLVTIPPLPALYDDGSGTGRSAVDIWTVLPVEYERAQAYHPPRISYVLGRGNPVWSYTALVQDGYSPKWEIDFLPLDYRISTGFINASLGLTGTLYWSVDYWTKHPWTDIDYPGGCSGNACWSYPGEGILVYPGREAGLVGVAPSLRLKYVRDGVQDYERIAILRRCGHGDEALALAQQVGAGWKDWTRDGAALLSVSRTLASLIVHDGCSP